MIDENSIKILKQAINKYGAKMYEDIAIEEMSELIKALLKHRRAGEIGEYNLSDTLSAIVEELADVEICLEYLKLIYSQTAPDFCDRVQQMIDYKVRRVERRIEMAKSADVQEVVRCNDCTHLCKDLSGRGCHLCMRCPLPREVTLDSFCSYGERMDGDENAKTNLRKP